MKAWLVALMVLIGFSPVYGDEYVPMDFAKGIVLDCDKGASIYRFTLPEHVYEGMVRYDFGDIRVFNAQDEEVPFTLKTPGEERFKKDTPEPHPLVLYPIFRNSIKEDATGRVSVHIVTDKNGAIIDVGNTPKNERQSSGTPDFYLVDLSKLADKPDSLEFKWNMVTNEHMAHIRIEESRDLDHWTRLVSSAVLADIRFGGNTLTRNTVSLPRIDAPYLKITMLDQDDPFRIESVTGNYSPIHIRDDNRWHWTVIKGTPSNTGAFDFEYTLTHPLPYERLRVSFPQKNTLARVTLKSKQDKIEPWTTDYIGLLYNLTMKGTFFEKTEVACYRHTDNQWLLSIDPNDGGIGKGIPSLELGWMPQTLYFVARGEGPFTVAYGSGTAEPWKGGVNALLSGMEKKDEKQFIMEASMTSVIELGGRKQLEKPKGPVPWKRIILWAILLGGVCLCAWMALSLVRQMGDSSTKG